MSDEGVCVGEKTLRSHAPHCSITIESRVRKVCVCVRGRERVTGACSAPSSTRQVMSDDVVYHEVMSDEGVCEREKVTGSRPSPFNLHGVASVESLCVRGRPQGHGPQHSRDHRVRSGASMCVCVCVCTRACGVNRP